MSESLTITLPDGSQKSVPLGSGPLDLAKSLGPRLADDAVVARVDGQLWDLTRPFEKDSKLEILTSKNPEAVSYTHLMPAGPPWMLRIIGYFLSGCQPIGFTRKPSMSQPSVLL